MPAYVILFTMNEDVQILKEIKKAVALCEKEYTRAELFKLLEIDSNLRPEIDIEKQICILKLSDILTHDEAELLIMRLTKDGEDYLFETIEDEAEFEKVAAYVESLEDEEYEEE